MRAEQVRRALTENLPTWGVVVLESHHASDFTMQWRTHAFVKIVYILAGSGRFDVGDQTFRFVAGDVIIVPPQTRNRIQDESDDPSSLYAGCVSEHVLASDPNLSDQLVSTCLHEMPKQTGAIASVLRRIIFTQERSAPLGNIDMVIDAWRLLRLVLSVASSTGKEAVKRTKANEEDESVVRFYVDQLQESFLQATSIDDAAADCEIPRRTFTKLFREVTGTTWLNYVRGLAIDHASELLRSTDLPIASVAFESGFSDLSTFYRQFSRHKGVSPASYRAGPSKA